VDMQALFKRLGGIKPVASDKFIPMTEVEIAAVEEDRGVRLPEAYRRFLTTYGASTFNGASPDNPFIVFRPLTPLPPQFKGSNGLFDAFYGAEREAHDGYSLRVRIRFYSGRMPESIIPIGDDGGAGQICLGVKGAEAGKVYYWEQQNEALDEEDYLEDYGEPRPPEAMFQNVHLVAKSFEDFLQRLEVRAD
jgi:hypothetical protein